MELREILVTAESRLRKTITSVPIFIVDFRKLARCFPMQRFVLDSVKNDKNNSNNGYNSSPNENIKTVHNSSSFLPRYIPLQNVITNRIIIPILTAMENFTKNSPAKNAAMIILAKSSKLCDNNFFWFPSINSIICIIQQLKSFVKGLRVN